MKLLFAHNGPSHLALLYAKMKRGKEFQYEDVANCFPTKFKKPYHASRALKRLKEHGLVSNTPRGWVITAHGVNYLYATARTPQGATK